MDIRFAIRIESDNQVFRYATKRTIIREHGVADIEYQPYIQKINVPEMEASLDFESSIPTINLSVWDGYRELVGVFTDMDYEALDVTVITVIDGEQEGEHIGYMADVKHDAGVTSFTVRMEAGDSGEFQGMFLTHKTFEYAEVLKPAHSPVSPSLSTIFETVEDTGWTMLEYVEERTVAASHVPIGASSINLTRGWGDNVLRTRVLNHATGTIENGQNYPVFRRATSSDPGPFYVNIADIADSKWATIGTEADPMLVQYSDIEEYGSSRIRLIGIPTSGPYSISRPIFERSIVSPAVSPSEAATRDSRAMYSRADNNRGSSIRAPRLFVRANKNIPLSLDDRKLGVGFIDLGVRRALNANDLILMKNFNPNVNWEEIDGLTSIRVPVYHRYHIDNMVRIESGEHAGSYILEIVLNINGLDPGLRYRITPAFNILYMYGSSQTSGETNLGKVDQEVRLVTCRHYVKTMDFIRGIINSEDLGSHQTDAGPGDGSRFKAALAKSRIDMVGDTRALLRDSVAEIGREDADDANMMSVNNATGKFGVPRTARVETLDAVTQLYVLERCEFDIPPTDVERVLQDWFEIPEEKRRYNSNYSNYLTYTDDRSKTDLMKEDSVYREAGRDIGKAFFASNVYSVRHQPIPENPTDIGKFFPIVYGYVKKVPLIHSISRKTSDVNKATAGDDVYIYASHKCAVETASDITVHLLRDDGSEGMSDDELRDLMATTRDNVVESPFPHKKTVIVPDQIRSEDPDTGFSTVQNLNGGGYITVLNPYHKTDTFITRDGGLLYGIKLRGEEWKESLGYQDPIYPIRNGVGNSRLYASFGGYVDEIGIITGRPGSLIEHPMDVIRHYLRTYGGITGLKTQIDIDSASIVKASTPKYHVSMYHDELDMDVDSLIDKICKQFGIFRFRRHGLLSFAAPSLEKVNMDKPLSDNVNLIIGTKEESDGYKTIYNRVVYRYRKNWATGEFDAQIDLNPSNNFYCAQADKARGGKETLEIEADFVSSSAVAHDVALRLATINSSRKVLYSCEAKYTDGIRFVPGDVVPMTYKHYDMVDEPVMVMKVKEDFDTIKLEVVRFTNLI